MSSPSITSSPVEPENPNFNFPPKPPLPPIFNRNTMGKKSKQPSAETSSELANLGSGSVFDKLFGDLPKGKDSVFTDDNPFRRRKIESLPPEQEIQPKIAGEDGNLVVKTMRKRDVKESVDEVLVEEKKERKMKRVDGEGERKKRKREEVEKEYEKRTLGVVVEEEGGEKAIVGKKRKKDESAEMTVEKEEGFDDESKLVRTVFVGNLPLKMKKKILIKEFSQFGDVESVRIRSVPIIDSKTPRKGTILKKQINEAVDSVNAYVVFKTEESAQASLKHNMAVVGGNHIRVDRACPPRKKLKGESTPIYDHRRTVFVGNLPFDVQDEEVYRLFCGIKELESAVEAVRVIRDPNSSVGKGIAYVLFKTREAAVSVLKKRNLKLRERELRLSHAKAESTLSKRKDPTSPSSDNTRSKKFAHDSPGTPSSSYSGVKTAAPLSYQGLRASQSGSQKKGNLRRPGTTLPQPTTQFTDKGKVRSSKRPAVAARKAKALKSSSGGSGSKQGGKKRKPDGGSSGSFHMSKKVRKF